MTSDRLRKQIEFIVEIDRLKHVIRQTYLMDSSRQENSAEHSWHFAVMAMLLAEYTDEPVDVFKAVKMALIHDVVEVDVGDIFIYDQDRMAEKEAMEKVAAKRLFGLLPSDQAEEYRALWEEFEARETPEARYAAAIDRLQPVLHNYYTHGKAWNVHGVRAENVLKVNSRIGNSSIELWSFAQEIIDESIRKGYLER
ncbi:HD domain-containing protein [Methanocella sp. MCL-LM]|uniref:HD domain-containing protein n=1 Tax=Methanocella sp. MCL-LM TaxID=3412035 RepID=UPI003C794CB8